MVWQSWLSPTFRNITVKSVTSLVEASDSEVLTSGGQGTSSSGFAALAPGLWPSLCPASSASSLRLFNRSYQCKAMGYPVEMYSLSSLELEIIITSEYTWEATFEVPSIMWWKPWLGDLKNYIVKTRTSFISTCDWSGSPICPTLASFKLSCYSGFWSWIRSDVIIVSIYLKNIFCNTFYKIFQCFQK